MVKIFGAVFRAVMNFIYSFFKLRKTKEQIVFISRQSKTPSTDFKYLINMLRKEYPQYKVVVLCKMIPDSFNGRVRYIGEMFRQMKALSQSKVAVLDGYCILACVLHHKSDLKIIQIWHALGALKKFGKSVLDKDAGKSSALASAMRMHNNYDLIAASGDKCVPFFAEAFGQSESKFIPIGMPRMDYLTDENLSKEIKERIFREYPRLNNGKKNILYVPTFRDSRDDRKKLDTACGELVSRVNYSEYNLIVKRHVVDSNRETLYTQSRLSFDEGEKFSGMDFMCVADAVITDYSSVIYEALLKDIPLYVYCFDSSRYVDERGFYIEFFRDVPAVFAETAIDVCRNIENGAVVDSEKIQTFKKDYVNKKYPDITAVYGKIIDALIKGTYNNEYNYKGC